jgi:nucleotide-binding universal stress UspA family protein
VAGNRAASLLKDFGQRKAPRKRSKPGAKGATLHTDLKRILVPVDFSPHSMNAVRFARDWAARFRAAVCLLHVIEPVNTTAPFGVQTMVLPIRQPDFHRELRTELANLARKEFSRSANVAIQLREGVPYDVIVSTARKLKSDIIIIATHGRTGLMRVLMGSTAERVVRHAPCPVLTVRST